MNKAPLLNNGFTIYNDSELLEKTNSIIQDTTGNSLYTDAGVKLTAVVTAKDGFVVAKARRGQALNYKLVKEEAKKTLIAALEALGEYIVNKYPNTPANWQTAGYSVQFFDNVTQVPAPPINVRAKDGEMHGNVILSCSKMQFAEFYEGRHWKQGETAPGAMTATGKARSTEFKGLEPGIRYFFQLRSRGTKGVSEWSEIISWLVR